MVRPDGRDLGQAPGQHDGRRVGQAQEGAVGHLLQLGGHGLVQLRAPVAVQVGPEGRDPVQIAAALEIIEIDAFAPGDDEELFLPEALHLGKGVPEVVPVPAPQGVTVVSHLFCLEEYLNFALFAPLAGESG